MKTLNIWFENFWGLFNKYDNFFIYVLKHKYNVNVTPHNPDYVFSDSPQFRKNGNYKAIYFSGEPFYYINDCDFALTTFYVDDERFMRLPLYCLFAWELYNSKCITSFDSIKIKDYSRETLKEKNKLITYISQGRGGNCPREETINECSKYFHIDCAGKHMNNHPIIQGEPGTPEGSINKINFLKQYKFCFAIENNDEFNGSRGYTTEKIYEPMVAGCIPVYWGNEKIDLEFNPNSILNMKNFNSYEALASKILEIDSNQSLYMDYLMEPYILNNKFFDIDYLVELFDKFI